MCWVFFFVLFLKDGSSGLEVNVKCIYLFIYLVPFLFQASTGYCLGFYCHVVFLFFYFFPLDLGTFWGRAAMLAGVKGLRWDSCCCPFCGGPLACTGVGLGSVWEGRGIADCT